MFGTQGTPTASSGLTYKGLWNASTNTPTLVSSVGTNGDYYIVSVAGSTNLNGITTWAVDDWAIFNGSVWQKIDNSDDTSWQLNGNTVASEKFFGTINAFDVPIRVENTEVVRLKKTSAAFTPSATSSGVAAPFTFTVPSNTNQTASTETIGVNIVGSTIQHATGALASQRHFVIGAQTYSFIAASTISDAYGLYVSTPVAGTNATITRSWAAAYNGNIAVSGNAFFGSLTTAATANVHIINPSQTSSDFLLKCGWNTIDNQFSVSGDGTVAIMDDIPDSRLSMCSENESYGTSSISVRNSARTNDIFRLDNSSRLRIGSNDWTDPVYGADSTQFTVQDTWNFAESGDSKIFNMANGAVTGFISINPTPDAMYFGTFSNHPLNIRTNNTTIASWSNAGVFNQAINSYFGHISTAPSAKIHIGAGTASAGTAPLKFTSGTNLTTAEAGAFEYNGTNFFVTRSGTTREDLLSGIQSSLNALGLTALTQLINQIKVNIGGNDYYIPCSAANTVLT